MSKLTEFYAHKASLLEKGEPIDPQWELLEDKLLIEELPPELIEQLKTVLLKVKSTLMFSGSYDPKGCLSVSFTRNGVQLSWTKSLLPRKRILLPIQLHGSRKSIDWYTSFMV